MLQLNDIYKSYDGNVIYSAFSLSVREGVTTGLLGPSGCGKTTLLNMIGGLVKPEKGEVTGVDGKTFSYIFQEPRLLPWLTVRQNLEFVFPGKEASEKIDYFLRLVELQDFADYYPSKLSGGMSQRVSIARAFAMPSDIILMDEPFSGIDVNLKKNIVNKFLQICESDRRTVIYVTHDIDEALEISDDIFVLSKSPVNVVFERQDIKKADILSLKEAIIGSM
ncbi:MAG: ABC transporter ATP-binding protein [bacterium]|nr:ABC transporter ATP-binding protein [Candidatus Limimorpha caballi]